MEKKKKDSPEGRNGNTLQYSCLQNSMDRGAWWDTMGPQRAGPTKRLSTARMM